jgi:hypothetical protein
MILVPCTDVFLTKMVSIGGSASLMFLATLKTDLEQIFRHFQI